MALVFAGCEGPAGPAGSTGAPGGGDPPQVIKDSFAAYAYAETLKKAGFDVIDPDYGKTIVKVQGGAGFSWPQTAGVPGNYTLPSIPDRVTLEFTTGTSITVPSEKTLTISGGADSRLSLSGNNVIVLNNGTVGGETTVNITVPTGVTTGHATPVSFGGANTALTLTNKTVTIDAAIGPNAALTGLGFTTAPALAQVNLVVEGALTAVTAAITVNSVTVNTSGTLTAAVSDIALTATNGITLNGGTLAGHASGKFDANVRVTKTSSLSTAKVTLSGAANTITVDRGVTLTAPTSVDLAAPGSIVVNGTLSLADITVTSTGKLEINNAACLCLITQRHPR
jgi:hypothetical protein